MILELIVSGAVHLLAVTATVRCLVSRVGEEVFHVRRDLVGLRLMGAIRVRPVRRNSLHKGFDE